jgi:hypothetical protein
VIAALKVNKGKVRKVANGRRSHPLWTVENLEHFHIFFHIFTFGALGYN